MLKLPTKNKRQHRSIRNVIDEMYDERCVDLCARQKLQNPIMCNNSTKNEKKNERKTAMDENSSEKKMRSEKNFTDKVQVRIYE